MKSSSIAYTDVPLFDTISPDKLRTMLGCLGSYEKHFHKGELIYMDHDDVHYIGIVLQGCVHMTKEDVWGTSTMLTYMNPGEMFGEMFAMQQKDKSSFVNFLAAVDTRVLFVPAQKIVRTCSNLCPFHQQLIQNMFDMMSRKSVHLMEKIEVSGKGSMREKILSYLSMLAQKQQSRYLTLPISKTQLAEYLGVNRSAMMRELSAMKNEGLIDYDRNTFVIH